MNKQLFIINNSSNMLSKKYINNLIMEINKIDISKHMKELILIASTNLFSPTKTSKGIIYQLELFKKQAKVVPEKTRSKYLNNLIADLNSLSTHDLIENIDMLTKYLQQNEISITVKTN
ncbi:MAG: hypothetical protein IKE01_03085 [Clostridia bacterium]|nr:hypothetical protein [Clostridia bacterium]